MNYVPGLGMYFDNLAQANKNLNGGCDLENVDPIGKATDRRHRAVSVSADHASGRGCGSDQLHRPQPLQEDPDGLLEGRRQEQHHVELGRQDRPDARAGHRRLAARLRAGVLDGRLERRGSPRLRRHAAGADGGRSHGDRDPRSVPRPVHHLPGSAGAQPPLHLHGPVGQLGNRGLQLRQDEGRRDRRVRQRGHPPRHDRRLLGGPAGPDAGRDER